MAERHRQMRYFPCDCELSREYLWHHLKVITTNHPSVQFSESLGYQQPTPWTRSNFFELLFMASASHWTAVSDFIMLLSCYIKFHSGLYCSTTANKSFLVVVRRCFTCRGVGRLQIAHTTGEINDGDPVCIYSRVCRKCWYSRLSCDSECLGRFLERLLRSFKRMSNEIEILSSKVFWQTQASRWARWLESNSRIYHWRDNFDSEYL